jgi:hypothetical protein
MDGSVVMLNTSESKSRGSDLLSAVRLESGRVDVHYLGSPGFEPVGEERRQKAEIPGGLNDMQLADFLRTANIVRRKRIGTGITKPEKLTLNKNGITLSASYKHFDSNPNLSKSSVYNARRSNLSDRYQYDVAAFRLDRFLGMYKVPVSVLRTIDGKEGVVQYWIPNTINERDRRKQNVEFSSNCSTKTQFRLRKIFDILIFNDDRNLTNLLYTRDDFMLRLIDHTRSFRSTVKRPSMYKRVEIELSELFKQRLQKLTLENLSLLLGDLLHPRQTQSIVKRRDLILAEAVANE